MNFCSNCKSLLRPTSRVSETEMSYKCPKCGAVEIRAITIRSEESRTIAHGTPSQRTTGIPVIEESYQVTTKSHVCSACGYNESTITEIKPNRWNDEQDEFLYKCLRCGKTDRLKTSGA